jgi:tRNA dimethylallyltransferase
MNEKLIVIVGPTAVGKTKTSIEVAKRFNGEIISGDSMQIYRGMDIGTAKISSEEMEGIPHHLIDIKDPQEPFSVAEFQHRTNPLITDITNRNKVPIIVGGTGLYIRSVTHDYDFTEVTSNNPYRKELEEFATQQGNVTLHEKLKEIDYDSYTKIHPNNVKRVIRALEIYKESGKTMTQYLAEQEHVERYDHIIIGLTMEREKLYERINHRVDMMMQEGLIEEVKALYDQGIKDCQSVLAIGYKELYQYFDGKCTLDEAIETLKRNSRRYAKRQLTWFRNQMEIEWVDMTDGNINKKIQMIIEIIAGKLKIEAKY